MTKGYKKIKRGSRSRGRNIGSRVRLDGVMMPPVDSPTPHRRRGEVWTF